MSSYILVLFGLLLIFLEFFLPGGVVGALGGVMVLIGMVLYVVQSDSMLTSFLFVFVTVVLVGVLIRFALWRIPRAKPGRSIYLRGDQKGYYASSYDASLIGKTGVVSSDLKPGGHVLIEGRVHQAISVSGYILKGEQITVIGGEGESLVVKKVKKKKES